MATLTELSVESFLEELDKEQQHDSSKIDLKKWAENILRVSPTEDYRGLMKCIIKYIDLIISYASRKDFKEQILTSRKYFRIIKEIITDDLKSTFVKFVTRRIFDFVIEEDVEVWCIKKEILKVFNDCVSHSKRHVRLQVITGLTNIYLYKMVDHISSYGDYDLQVTIIETIFRMYGKPEITPKLFEMIPESQELSARFAKINSESFDDDCRDFLNVINRKFDKIFSIICESVHIDDNLCLATLTLKDGMWIDFNLWDGAVSWYQRCGDPPNDDVWELITLFSSTVESAYTHCKSEGHIFVRFHLSGRCITSIEANQRALNKATSVTILFKKSEDSDKLISKVLPYIFGNRFKSHLKPSPRVLTFRSNYKPLSVRLKRRSKSLTSVSKTDMSLRSIINPASCASTSLTSPKSRSTSRNSGRIDYNQSECEDSISTDDPNKEDNAADDRNEDEAMEASGPKIRRSQSLQILSGKCSDSSVNYRKITRSLNKRQSQEDSSFSQSYSTAQVLATLGMKNNKKNTSSSSERWQTAEEKFKSNTEPPEEFNSLDVNIFEEKLIQEIKTIVGSINVPDAKKTPKVSQLIISDKTDEDIIKASGGCMNFEEQIILTNEAVTKMSRSSYFSQPSKIKPAKNLSPVVEESKRHQDSDELSEEYIDKDHENSGEGNVLQKPPDAKEKSNELKISTFKSVNQEVPQNETRQNIKVSTYKKDLPKETVSGRLCEDKTTVKEDKPTVVPKGDKLTLKDSAFKGDTTKLNRIPPTQEANYKITDKDDSNKHKTSFDEVTNVSQDIKKAKKDKEETEKTEHLQEINKSELETRTKLCRSEAQQKCTPMVEKSIESEKIEEPEIDAKNIQMEEEILSLKTSDEIQQKKTNKKRTTDKAKDIKNASKIQQSKPISSIKQKTKEIADLAELNKENQSNLVDLQTGRYPKRKCTLIKPVLSDNSKREEMTEQNVVALNTTRERKALKPLLTDDSKHKEITEQNVEAFKTTRERKRIKPVLTDDSKLEEITEQNVEALKTTRERKRIKPVLTDDSKLEEITEQNVKALKTTRERKPVKPVLIDNSKHEEDTEKNVEALNSTRELNPIKPKDLMVKQKFDEIEIKSEKENNNIKLTAEKNEISTIVQIESNKSLNTDTPTARRVSEKRKLFTKDDKNLKQYLQMDSFEDVRRVSGEKVGQFDVREINIVGKRKDKKIKKLSAVEDINKIEILRDSPTSVIKANEDRNNVKTNEEELHSSHYQHLVASKSNKRQKQLILQTDVDSLKEIADLLNSDDNIFKENVSGLNLLQEIIQITEDNSKIIASSNVQNIDIFEESPAKKQKIQDVTAYSSSSERDPMSTTSSVIFETGENVNKQMPKVVDPEKEFEILRQTMSKIPDATIPNKQLKKNVIIHLKREKTDITQYERLGTVDENEASQKLTDEEFAPTQDLSKLTEEQTITFINQNQHSKFTLNKEYENMSKEAILPALIPATKITEVSEEEITDKLSKKTDTSTKKFKTKKKKLPTKKLIQIVSSDEEPKAKESKYEKTKTEPTQESEETNVEKIPESDTNQVLVKNQKKPLKRKISDSVNTEVEKITNKTIVGITKIRTDELMKQKSDEKRMSVQFDVEVEQKSNSLNQTKDPNQTTISGRRRRKLYDINDLSNAYSLHEDNVIDTTKEIQKKEPREDEKKLITSHAPDMENTIYEDSHLTRRTTRKRVQETVKTDENDNFKSTEPKELSTSKKDGTKKSQTKSKDQIRYSDIMADQKSFKKKSNKYMGLNKTISSFGTDNCKDYFHMLVKDFRKNLNDGDSLLNTLNNYKQRSSTKRRLSYKVMNLKEYNKPTKKLTASRESISFIQHKTNTISEKKVNVISDIRLENWKNVPPSPKKPRHEHIEETHSHKNASADVQFDYHKNSLLKCELLVSEPAPCWTAIAVFNNKIVTLDFTDYLGKFLVLLFYPCDFAELPYAYPPTEILRLNENFEQFQEINTNIVVCSVDTFFTHKKFIQTWLAENSCNELRFPLIADVKQQLCEKYKVLFKDSGHSARAAFIINPDGYVAAKIIIEITKPIRVEYLLEYIKDYQ